ncbi:unnamed protein product, partial [marine sediment metagenome]
SQITVYIKGGVAPYTFVTASHGYSFDLGGGETYSDHDQLHCADGECVVNFAAIAEITITDACGDVVEAVIRCTSGHWSAGEYHTYIGHTAGNCNSCSQCTNIQTYELGGWKEVYAQSCCTSLYPYCGENPPCNWVPSGWPNYTIGHNPTYSPSATIHSCNQWAAHSCSHENRPPDGDWFDCSSHVKGCTIAEWIC